MKVTLLQTNLVWEDKRANLQHIEQHLSKIDSSTDLLLLPEMFTTGFTMNAAPVAEDMEGETMQWLEKKASTLDAVIAGSFIVKEKDHFYNRLVWMYPDGKYEVYDKRHLFTLAGEQNHYKAGERRLIVEWEGWKICPLICYDLRFPVWSRNTEQYDLLIYVANWPERRRHAWQSLLVARAIENQAYTLGVNRVGLDGNEVKYSGGTCLVDYAGEYRVKLGFQEAHITVELDKNSQDAFRKRFAFLADRDQFELKTNQ